MVNMNAVKDVRTADSARQTQAKKQDSGGSEFKDLMCLAGGDMSAQKQEADSGGPSPEVSEGSPSPEGQSVKEPDIHKPEEKGAVLKLQDPASYMKNVPLYMGMMEPANTTDPVLLSVVWRPEHIAAGEQGNVTDIPSPEEIKQPGLANLAQKDMPLNAGESSAEMKTELTEEPLTELANTVKVLKEDPAVAEDKSGIAPELNVQSGKPASQMPDEEGQALKAAVKSADRTAEDAASKINGQMQDRNSAGKPQENVAAEYQRAEKAQPEEETGLTKMNNPDGMTEEIESDTAVWREAKSEPDAGKHSGEKERESGQTDSAAVLTQERPVKETEHFHFQKADKTELPTAGVKVREPEELPKAVMNQLLQKLAANQKEFTVQIEPANLGKLLVKVLQSQEGTTISILCTSSKTLEVLAQNAKQIGYIMEENLGGPTAIYVEKGEENYLNQNNGGGQDRQEPQEESHKQSSRRQEEEQSMSFLQQLRLGLTPLVDV